MRARGGRRCRRLGNTQEKGQNRLLRRVCALFVGVSFRAESAGRARRRRPRRNSLFRRGATRAARLLLLPRGARGRTRARLLRLRFPLRSGRTLPQEGGTAFRQIDRHSHYMANRISLLRTRRIMRRVRFCGNFGIIMPIFGAFSVKALTFRGRGRIMLTVIFGGIL